MLYVADNTRHRVARYDRSGRLLSAFSKASRSDPAGFGSCCNPMNVCFGPDGALYTSEASLHRIKRYSTSGKYLGPVGTYSARGGCKHVAVAVGKSGRDVYVIDVSAGNIRVLRRGS
ncbi:MAG: hypothetical protein J7M21_02275 [Planctomycetes bacterium]|nr:hypothetical protein [Planctomycetota bacterium]